MLVSKTLMRVLCLKLGLNCGMDSTDYNSITILSIEPIEGSSKYCINGFHSEQDRPNMKDLINTPFEVVI